MKNNKILFTNHTSTISGAERVLLDIASDWPNASAFLFEPGPLAIALRDRGVEVAVSRHGSGLSGFKRNSSLLSALPLAGKLIMTLIELISKSRRYDIVYANSQKAFILAAIASIIARRQLIWHLHDIISARHFSSGARRLQVMLANRRASRVIVPSHATANAFIASGGRADLVEVIPNGLSRPRQAEAGSMLRRNLDLPEGDLIGVFSRIAAWKGQHIVLQAIAELPGVQAVIAGSALFDETVYEEKLRSLTAELGIADRVHFLGQRTDVSALMQACDIVVHPSIDPEPFGLTLIEAMLAETPLIATDTGGSTEILDGGKFGALVPPGDVAALVSNIRGILGDREAAQYRAKLARARAESIYNLESVRAGISRAVAGVVVGVR